MLDLFGNDPQSQNPGPGKGFPGRGAVGQHAREFGRFFQRLSVSHSHWNLRFMAGFSKAPV